MKKYQIELIKLQNYLEKENKRMIILFEGRDASGKGGAIRRITRYMNNKHYRIVALGKPDDTQRNQWFLQRYITHFPTGGEIVLFDRSWYNRAMVEPIFGFCTPEEHEIFMEDIVNLTVIDKTYLSGNTYKPNFPIKITVKAEDGRMQDYKRIE